MLVDTSFSNLITSLTARVTWKVSLNRYMNHSYYEQVCVLENKSKFSSE